MIVKRFSQRILGTNGAFGFTRGRKYDMDLDRLGRTASQGELSRSLNDELREERKKMSRGLRWSDLKDND